VIRTLIVDDDHDVARMHTFLVTALDGFEVAGFLDRGGPVLAFLEENQVDLVLLDVHLPDMDGVQVLEDLRTSGHRAGVIMITAASERNTVRNAVGRGIDDYLVKPFTAAEFNRRLQFFAESRSGSPRSQEPPLDQGDVDSLLRSAGLSRASSEAAAPGATALPKGFSPHTLELVAETLRDNWGEEVGGLSASDVAQASGLSRVSARRYLEMMARRGMVELRPRYGAPGRPEHQYRWLRD